MGLELYAPTTDDYKPASEGTHVARCLRVVDLGTQDTEFQGKKMERAQVVLQFILLDDDLINPVVTRRYTASLHPKSGLRQDLENWVGKIGVHFTLQSVLNKPCLVTITHKEKNGRVFANVSSVAAVPKNINVPETPAEYEPLCFDLNHPDKTVFDKLPARMRADILNSKEVLANPELRSLLTEYSTADVFDIETEEAPF
jgi:hypothetical protein